MKKIIFSTVALLLTIELNADNNSIERLDLSMEIGIDNGSNNPTFFIPMYWSDNWYSGIGYKTSSTYLVDAQETLTGKGKLVTGTSSESLDINVLSYQRNYNNSNYSVGLTTNFETDTYVTSGYVHNKVSDEVVAFDGLQTFESIGLGIYADYTIRNIYDFFSLRIGTTITPLILLNFDETQSKVPSIEEQAQLVSSSFQDVQYDLFISMQFDVSSFLEIIANFSYEYIPISSDALGIDISDVNNQYFTESNFSYRASTTDMNIKFLLPKFNFSGIKPAFGVGKRYFRSTISSSSGLSEENNSDDNYFIIGMNKSF